MAGRYGKLNRKGAKATGDISVGIVNGQPSIQVNSGGKIYGTQLSQVGASGLPDALNVSSIRVTGNVTFGKNSAVFNNSNRVLLTGGLTASGDNNIAIGSHENLTSLIGAANNTNNISIGDTVLAAAINAKDNIAIGHNAMEYMGRHASEPYGDTQNNVAIGNEALQGYSGEARTQGSYNIAIGFQAMENAHRLGGTAGSTWYNVCIGTIAGENCSSAYNTYVGHGAGQGNASGSGGSGLHGFGNVGVGYYSLQGVQTGYRNVAVGYEALNALRGTSGTEAWGNVAIGYIAGTLISTGANNICIGAGAGDNITSGDGNFMVGNVEAASATGDNQLKIGSGTGSVTWIQGASDGKVGITGLTWDASIA